MSYKFLHDDGIEEIGLFQGYGGVIKVSAGQVCHEAEVASWVLGMHSQDMILHVAHCVSVIELGNEPANSAISKDTCVARSRSNDIWRGYGSRGRKHPTCGTKIVHFIEWISRQLLELVCRRKKAAVATRTWSHLTAWSEGLWLVGMSPPSPLPLTHWLCWQQY